MKPPIWFVVVALVALLWNAAGLIAVVADMRLSPTDIAALPADQQALYNTRPGWSVLGSVVGTVGGTLGCILLLSRKRLAGPVLLLSLVGVIIQDVGIVVVASTVKMGSRIPFVLQGVVLLVAIALLWLARRAGAKGWLA